VRAWGLRWRRATRDDRPLAWVAASGVASALLLAPLLPTLARFAPACPFHAWTGLPCPGCGATRAVLSFLRGDVLGALSWNPLAAGALALASAAGALAPVWVAAGGPVPALDAVLPARTRWAMAAALAFNWAYLVVRRV
jgi:hypothetical protein